MFVAVCSIFSSGAAGVLFCDNVNCVENCLYSVCELFFGEAKIKSPIKAMLMASAQVKLIV